MNSGILDDLSFEDLENNLKERQKKVDQSNVPTNNEDITVLTLSQNKNKDVRLLEKVVEEENATLITAVDEKSKRQLEIESVETDKGKLCFDDANTYVRAKGTHIIYGDGKTDILTASCDNTSFSRNIVNNDTIEQVSKSKLEHFAGIKNQDTDNMSFYEKNTRTYLESEQEKEQSVSTYGGNQVQRNDNDRSRRVDESKYYCQEVKERRGNKKSFAVKKIAITLYRIIFWLLSLALIVFSIGVFAVIGAVNGTVFVLTGILINPLIDDMIEKHLFKYPRWIVVVILIVGFFAGVLIGANTRN